MQNGTCFFTGHRDTSSEVYPSLVAEVEHHITKFGVTDFYVGHYGAFDSMAARAVIEAKKRHPKVRLTMLLPYHPTIRPVETPKGFDGSYFPEGQEKTPPRTAILRANEHMIRNSDYLICFVKHPSAGSREVMETALKRQKSGLIHVTNLAGWYPEV